MVVGQCGAPACVLVPLVGAGSTWAEPSGREWEQGLWCSALADHPPLCGITSQEPLRNGTREDYNWGSTSYSLGTTGDTLTCRGGEC